MSRVFFARLTGFSLIGMKYLILPLMSLGLATAAMSATSKPETFEVELKVSDSSSKHEIKTRLALEADQWTTVSGKRSGVSTIQKEGAAPTYSCDGDDAVLARYVPGTSSDGKRTLRIEFLVIDTGKLKVIQAAPAVIILPGHSATLEQQPKESGSSSTFILKVTHLPNAG